ncbi:MAG: hypothetical protein HY652_09570 [Acidobacteria bacterium]|nr:hypothetical protein [Acidobacteriota bacterium]
MTHGSHSLKRVGVITLACLAAAVAAWTLLAREGKARESYPAVQAAVRRPTGSPQLVSYEPLPEMGDSELCAWMPVSSSSVATLRQDQLWARAAATRALDEKGVAVEGDRAPRRVIRDPDPTYSAIAVDPVRDEVVLQDENLYQILVYDRLDHTPPQAAMTEPKRIIGGIKTKVEFNCGLYVDPKTGDIYSVNNDTVNTLVVFSRKARGNVAPDRELYTPHGTYGIAVDEEDQEFFLTVQHDNAVVVYPKIAKGKDAPVRLLQGDHTGLADPHGIAVDTKNDLVFVSNHGSVHQVRAEAGEGSESGSPKANWPLDRDMAVRGSGQLLPPSITVYSRTASGDTAPLRVIAGPKTQLNWPAGIAVEPERGELFVANDAGDSILIFSTTASGDVAPIRVLKGPKTGIKNPTGLFVDTKNNELWVANFANHSATVHRLTADGDTAPLRTIRAAPRGKFALGIGNPGAIAYDTKREEILVPN